jgi:hypothetical protein
MKATIKIILIFIIFVIQACKGDKPIPPILTTSAITAISQTTGTSGGTITNDGGLTITSRGVCWSTGTTPTIEDSKSLDGAGAGSYISIMTNLFPGTVYFVKAYATNETGTGYGMAMSFTTSGTPPSIPVAVVQNATNIESKSATLNGSVNAKNLSTVVTFEFGITSNYGSLILATQNPIAGVSDKTVSASISNLLPETTYHFRIKAENALGVTYSSDMTFNTSSLAVNPILPPYESMIIDFSNFSATKATENSNWEFATSVTGIWKILVNTTLNVPITAYKFARDQSPVNLSDNIWQWSYNVIISNETYKTRLTGETRTSNILWKMYISKEGIGGFPEFVWFEGTSNLDGKFGQWIFKESFVLQTAILQIDWTKITSSINTVKYTYVKSSSFSTSYIEYGLTNNTLNAYYSAHYYNGTKFSEASIEWNTTSHNGRVKCIDYLGDNIWHCWDANKINVICP